MDFFPAGRVCQPPWVAGIMSPLMGAIGPPQPSSSVPLMHTCVHIYVQDVCVFVYLSSRRAKRAGWPEGLKGPEGTFRPFGPAGALRRRLLHRNGTFVPPAPSTRTRRRVKTGFRRKTGRSRAVCESIRKIPTGKITEIFVASQPLIRFFPPKARNGPFCPFFGP